MTLHRQAAGLTVMHAAEVVQPLLILPYAGYVLGPAAFGRYAYILALTQIASVIVDYGFTLTARRAAAPARLLVPARCRGGRALMQRRKLRDFC